MPGAVKVFFLEFTFLEHSFAYNKLPLSSIAQILNYNAGCIYFYELSLISATTSSLIYAPLSPIGDHVYLTRLLSAELSESDSHNQLIGNFMIGDISKFFMFQLSNFMFRTV